MEISLVLRILDKLLWKNVISLKCTIQEEIINDSADNKAIYEQICSKPKKKTCLEME